MVARKTIRNKGYFGLINRLLFFSKHSEHELDTFFSKNYPQKDLRFLDILGYDSLNSERITFAMAKARMDQDTNYFDEQIYLNLIRYLQPPYHQKEDGLRLILLKYGVIETY